MGFKSTAEGGQQVPQDPSHMCGKMITEQEEEEEEWRGIEVQCDECAAWDNLDCGRVIDQLVWCKEQQEFYGKASKFVYRMRVEEDGESHLQFERLKSKTRYFFLYIGAG